MSLQKPSRATRNTTTGHVLRTPTNFVVPPRLAAWRGLKWRSYNQSAEIVLCGVFCLFKTSTFRHLIILLSSGNR
jgi:hypothetical protein